MLLVVAVASNQLGMANDHHLGAPAYVGLGLQDPLVDCGLGSQDLSKIALFVHCATMDLARYLCSPPEAAGKRARAAHFSRPSKSFYLYSTFSRSRSSKSNVVSRRACLSSAAVDKHLILHLATAVGSSTFTSLLPKINKFQFSSFIYLELNTLTVGLFCLELVARQIDLSIAVSVSYLKTANGALCLLWVKCCD